MAQPRRQYEGAMNSIFDFIFEQSEKPPNKRKPVKLTGVDGTSEVVESLAAILEGPGTFVNDANMDALKEFSDIDLAKIEVNSRGIPIKFNLNEIGEMFSNPSDYVDKKFAIAEAIRKKQKFANAGEIMGSWVAESWARKRGLDAKTREAMRVMGRPNAFRKEMVGRTEELMEKHFGNSKVGMRLMEKHFGSSGSAAITEKDLVEIYGGTKGKQMFKRYKEAQDNWKSRKTDNKSKNIILDLAGDRRFYSLFYDKRIYEAQKKHVKGSPSDRATWRDGRMRFSKRGEGRLHFSEKQIEEARREMEDELSGVVDLQRKEMEVELSRFKGIDKNFFITIYGSKLGTKYFDTYEKARIKWSNKNTDYDNSVDLAKLMNDSTFFAALEAYEIYKKRGFTKEEGARMAYATAAGFVGNMAVARNNPLFFNQNRITFISETKKTINDLQRQIAELKRQGASGREISKVRGTVKELRSDLRIAKRYDYASAIGRWEGWYHSAKDMFVDGNLLPYIVNGKFFSPTYNQIEWLQPAAESSLYTGRKDKNGKTTADFLAPVKTGNRFRDNYNAGMMHFYYLSPATWIKTLYTGEGFAYLAYLSQEKIRKLLGNQFSDDDISGILGKIAEGDLDSLLNSLKGKMSPETLKKFEKLASKLSRRTKLTHFFSSFSRWKKEIQKKIDDLFGRKVRDFIGNKILLKLGFILKDKATVAAVNLWMKTGGLYTMIRSVVTAGMKALGLAFGGPIGALLTSVITWVAMGAIMKIVKPITKVSLNFLKYGLIGFLGIIAFLLVFIISIFGQHSHVTPGSCEDCGDYWATYAHEYRYGPDPRECIACDGEAFATIQGLPSYDSIPSIAKDYFKNYIEPKITPELMEVYAKTEEATGVPCEIIAAIHYMEGGMRLDGSLHDGGSLRGGDLLSDAISAMNHFKTKLSAAGVDVGSMTYETLAEALSYYNGPGNGNCTYFPGTTDQPRPTRWRDAGNCPANFIGEDHIYAVNWISERHMEMDLIYCRDGVEFSCDTELTFSVPVGQEVCYKGAGTVCNPQDTEGNTRKYPVFKRPGAITIAIMLANNKYDCGYGNGGGGGGGEGGVGEPLHCLSRPTFTGSGGSHPYGSQIVSIANMIVGHLDTGHWNYYNKPRSSMPSEYATGAGGLKWKQELYDNPNTRDNYAVLGADAYSLYWCTWLTKDSYRGASVPGNGTVFATLSVRLQAAAFATGGGGYDFVCNGPGIINGIAPGDVVFFYDERFTHVGVVSSVSSSVVGTVESNSGRTTYDYAVADDGSVNNPYIIGFGRYR